MDYISIKLFFKKRSKGGRKEHIAGNVSYRASCTQGKAYIPNYSLLQYTMVYSTVYYTAIIKHERSLCTDREDLRDLLNRTGYRIVYCL